MSDAPKFALPDRLKPSMRLAWSVVFLGFLMQVMGAGPVYYAYGNYAVAFAEEFSAPRSIINIGFTVLGIFGNVGSAPVGIAADRWSIRYIAMFGVIGTSLGFYLVSLSTNIWHVVLLFSSLIALADICIGNVVSNYLVSNWFERRRGLALGLSVLGASTSGIIFPPLTDYLIGAYGWRSTFVIYAVLILTILPPVWALARLPTRIPKAELSNKTSASQLPPMSIRQLLRNRTFWVISLAVGTMIGANTGTMVSLVSFGKARGLTTADASYLLSVLGICAMIGKVGLGAVSDRLSHRAALQLGIGLQIIAMATLAFGQGFGVMLFGVGTFGLGLGAMMPVWGAALAASFGLASYGRALGCSRVLMTPISMVFPIIAGWVFDVTGDYSWAWLSFAAMLGCAFIGTLLWKTARPEPIMKASDEALAAGA